MMMHVYHMSLCYALYLDSACVYMHTCSCVAAWRWCTTVHAFVELNAFP